MIDLVISGGQTGADQGGLRAAKAEDFATGGWAPRGWRTDEGPAPWLANFGLQEEPYFLGYRIRTLKNVRMADAVIWVGNPESPGGVLTCPTAEARGLPVLYVVYPYGPDPIAAMRDFIWKFRAADRKTLMIAGNRERTNPGIGAFTERVLGEALIPF